VDLASPHAETSVVKALVDSVDSLNFAYCAAAPYDSAPRPPPHTAHRPVVEGIVKSKASDREAAVCSSRTRTPLTNQLTDGSHHLEANHLRRARF
jgi:hypothetical protein